MLKLDQTQYETLNRSCIDRFYSNLQDYLEQSFPEYDPVQSRELRNQCRTACEQLRILNEDGIYAYHILSFMAGGSLQGSPDYQIAHRRYILLGYTADQLPLDLQEALTQRN